MQIYNLFFITGKLLYISFYKVMFNPYATCLNAHQNRIFFKQKGITL